MTHCLIDNVYDNALWSSGAALKWLHLEKLLAIERQISFSDLRLIAVSYTNMLVTFIFPFERENLLQVPVRCHRLLRTKAVVLDLRNGTCLVNIV